MLIPFYRRYLFGLLVIFLWLPAVSSAEETPDQAPVEVFVNEIKPEVVADTTVFGGIVQAGADYVVVSEQAGIIEKVVAQHGQDVAKGQPLFVIRPQGSGMSFRHYRILSPVAGEVGIVDARVGDLVENGAELTKVADAKRLLNIEVTAGDLEMIRPGKPCLASSAVAGSLEKNRKQTSPQIACKVESVARRARVNTGTFPVRLALSCQGDGAILCRKTFLPGTFARVSFRDNERDAILVSQKYLNRQRNKVFVLQQDHTIKAVAIELGQQFSGRIEILSGLASGDLLVTDTNRQPKDGERAVIVDPDAPLISEGEAAEDSDQKSQG